MRLSAIPVALALAIAFPSGADAQLSDLRTWNLFCSPGALPCMSVSLQFEYDDAARAYGHMDGGVTSIFYTLQNNQGQPELPGVDPFNLSAVTFRGLSWMRPPEWEASDLRLVVLTSNGGVSGQYTLQGGATTTGFPHREHLLAYDPVNVATLTTFGLVGAQFWGCGVRTPAHVNYFQTCGGSVEWRLDYPGRFDFTDATLDVRCPTASCTTVATTAGVPEPATGLLLLSGILGLGIAAWRRRSDVVA